jgi:hypothetical protein
LLRYPQENSRGMFDTHWPFLFIFSLIVWI